MKGIEVQLGVKANLELMDLITWHSDDGRQHYRLVVGNAGRYGVLDLSDGEILLGLYSSLAELWESYENYNGVQVISHKNLKIVSE